MLRYELLQKKFLGRLVDVVGATLADLRFQHLSCLPRLLLSLSPSKDVVLILMIRVLNLAGENAVLLLKASQLLNFVICTSLYEIFEEALLKFDDPLRKCLDRASW